MRVRAVQKLNVLKLRIQTRNLTKTGATDPHLSLRGRQDQPFWHLVDTKYGSGLGFTAPLCDSSKCLSAVYESLNLAYESRIKGENLYRMEVRVVGKLKVLKLWTACIMK